MLTTWRANEMVVPVGFREEHTYMQEVPGANSGNTLKGTILAANSNELLPSIRLELEARDSEFIDLAVEQKLETAYLNIHLDK